MKLAPVPSLRPWTFRLPAALGNHPAPCSHTALPGLTCPLLGHSPFLSPALNALSGAHTSQPALASGLHTSCSSGISSRPHPEGVPPPHSLNHHLLALPSVKRVRASVALVIAGPHQTCLCLRHSCVLSADHTWVEGHAEQTAEEPRGQKLTVPSIRCGPSRRVLVPSSLSGIPQNLLICPHAHLSCPKGPGF